MAIKKAAIKLMSAFLFIRACHDFNNGDKKEINLQSKEEIVPLISDYIASLSYDN